MEISVTGRHVSVTPAIKDYARKKIESLDIDFPKIIEVHVILDVEKFRHIAEAVVRCNAHISIEAREVSDDLYASIDKVVDKVARQMRKYKTKIQNHHRPRTAQAYEAEQHILTGEGLEEEEGAYQPRVVRTEKFAVKPMYVDEAVLQMEIGGMQFLVFLNAETEKINVVYRRTNGDFGLIIPSVQ